MRAMSKDHGSHRHREKLMVAAAAAAAVAAATGASTAAGAAAAATAVAAVPAADPALYVYDHGGLLEELPSPIDS